jgi:hypothetical protein
MTAKEDEFPLLTELRIPVQYNFAGVPFVAWLDLRSVLRELGWEGLFIAQAEKVLQIPNGFVAYDLESTLKEFKERLD